MRIVQKITPAQRKRVMIMSMFAFSGIVSQYLMATVADAKIKG